MKQLIASIAIIVVLIVFFVFVCRQDFNHHDAAQTVQSGSSTTNRKPSVSVPEMSPFTGVTPAIETMPAPEFKPMADQPAVIEAKPVAEAKPVDTMPFAKTKSEEKPVPAAVPVCSPEEAGLLAEKQEKEREETKKRGWVFYEEKFVTMRNVSSNIQQTENWNYVAEDGESDTAPVAKKQDYFSIKTEKPIEYVFSEPLYEYMMYQYSLCCSVKGEGVVTLSRKGGDTPKEFSIHSNTFEMLAYTLGNGESFDTRIVPSITFKGDMQIESITVQQKEIFNQGTVCLGSIESISNVPDINKTDYPDCYYTAKLVVKDILDGNPAPQNIQLLIPAFLNNKIDPLSAVMEKGNWIVSIRPFSLATEKEQEIERVDEIESYLFTPYILVAASPGNIPELTVSGIPILEGESYVSPFDNPVNPPLPANYVEVSKREIKKELAKVNSIIEQVEDDESINTEFQLAWDEKQKQYDALDSTRIWAKEQNSFFALPRKWNLIPSSRITEDNVDAIVELDRLFKINGIQFIVQLVPDYRDIAALVLNPGFQKYGDQRSARAAKQLLERGVEVQYISDEIVKNAFDYERLFFYPEDFHPDEGAMDIMTTLMSQRFEMFGDLLPKDLDVGLFSRENRDTGYKDELKWPRNVDIGIHEAGLNVQVPYVLYNNEILEQNPDSKVLVFGNSFTQEPMTKNAYISYLASKIMHTCSCRAMGGESALTALLQLFLSNPEKYFKNKSIAVLPISITYLTDNRYVFTKVETVDEIRKNAAKSRFITTLPIKQDGTHIFPSSFNFSYPNIGKYLPIRTSCISLSVSHPGITLPIPEGIEAKRVRISIQPLYNYGVSILINGHSIKLPSRFNPSWEILEFELEETDKSISVEIDVENCSTPNAKVLVGSVSLFE